MTFKETTNKTPIYDAGVATVPKEGEPEIPVMASAVPLDNKYNNMPYNNVYNSDTGPKQDYNRFYCSNCQAPYDLPRGATSWRCSNCMTFNNTVADECPCCVIS